MPCSRAMNKKRAKPGFSLIEIVIAAFLLAMLGIALSQALTNAISGQKEIEEISTRYHLARQALERMANEISMAYVSAHNNATSPVASTRFKGDSEKISFNAFGHVPFTSNAKESDQREISFFLGKDLKTEQNALMRKLHVNNTLKTGEEGRDDTLCTFVKSIEFKYWDATSNTWLSEWNTQGGLDAKKTLPARVKIEMVVMIEDELEQKFMTESEIWLTKPINILR